MTPSYIINGYLCRLRTYRFGWNINYFKGHLEAVTPIPDYPLYSPLSCSLLYPFIPACLIVGEITLHQSTCTWVKFPCLMLKSLSPGPFAQIPSNLIKEKTFTWINYILNKMVASLPGLQTANHANRQEGIMCHKPYSWLYPI